MLGYLNPAHLVGGAVKLDAEKARRVFADKIADAAGHGLERAALRRASDRRLQHDPRDQGGVDRARPRSARVRAVRVRRQRPGVRLRHGRGAGHDAHRRAAVRRACSRRSVCCTPMSSTITRAPSAGCCARPICARSSAPGTRLPGRRSAQLAAKVSRGARARLRALGGAALPRTDLRADRARSRRPHRLRDGAYSRKRSARSTRRPTATAPGRKSRSSSCRSRSSGRECAQGPACPSACGRAGPSPRRPAAPRLLRAENGWMETPVMRRSDLASRARGPLIIEEYDATCVVPPGARASARCRRQHRGRAHVGW